MGISSRKIADAYPHRTEGSSFFAVITPTTKCRFMDPFRPKPYFILETKIERVTDGAGGFEYFLDTHYLVDAKQVYLDVETAKAELARVFEAETDGMLASEKMTVVSAAMLAEAERQYHLEKSKERQVA